jgi:hypothetical protein
MLVIHFGKLNIIQTQIVDVFSLQCWWYKVVMFDSVEKITVENEKEIVVKKLFWFLSVVKWTFGH